MILQELKKFQESETELNSLDRYSVHRVSLSFCCQKHMLSNAVVKHEDSVAQS
jgi:hypothetical protein